MTDYVRRGGMDVQPPPWKCDDVEGYVFYLPANRSALQEVCDRTLNIPSNYKLRYSPVVDYVVLTFQRLTGLHSISPHAHNNGRHTYCEVSFWVMVKDRSANRGTELLIPYIFAGDGLAVSAGRETFGYPKEYAAIRMPGHQSPAHTFDVECLAVHQQGGNAIHQSVISCVSNITGLLSVGVATAGLPDLWPQIRAIQNADTYWLGTNQLLEQAGFGRLGMIWEVIKIWLSQRTQSVFLRQFRALGGGSMSDLTQVVQVELKPFIIKRLSILPGAYNLNIANLPSHPMANDFGLAANPQGFIDVPLGIKVDLEFKLNAGTVVWP